MNHAQKYLAQANRQIAELTVQIAAQRVIVKQALDTGQRSEMAESLLDALEGSLRIFERHRIFLLSCNDHPAPFRRVTPRSAGVCHGTGSRPSMAHVLAHVGSAVVGPCADRSAAFGCPKSVSSRNENPARVRVRAGFREPR